MTDKNQTECCDVYEVHEDIVQTVKKQLPDEEQLYDLAELYKVFGDSTRIKILYVSHQLRVLKQSRLVKFRREGKTVFYSLNDRHVEQIINQGMEHITE